MLCASSSTSEEYSFSLIQITNINISINIFSLDILRIYRKFHNNVSTEKEYKNIYDIQFYYLDFVRKVQ